MELEFEEYLGPMGLKLGNKVKLLGEDTIYELIIADGALYLYDGETCTIRNPLDLQRGFEKVEPKKKEGSRIIMNKIIKKTILESLRCSINEARDFMENYERNVVFGETSVITNEFDAGEYERWANYRKNLLTAYNEIVKVEVDE